MAYANGYTYRRTVTIDNTKVSGSANLTDFPVLILGTYTYLKTTGNGGNVESANGYDIVFARGEDGSNALDFERVSWSATTGAVEFWVEIPTLDYNDDTVIYMFYGNSSESTDQQNASGTWNSNYKAVYHLNETSTGAGAITRYDSTSNNNDLTLDGNNVSSIAGKIGNGADFNIASSESLAYDGDPSTLDLTAISVEMQFKPDNLPHNNNLTQVLANKGDTNSQRGFLLYMTKLDADNTNLYLFISDDGSASAGHFSQAKVRQLQDADEGSWHHLVFTWQYSSGDVYTGYLDGTTEEISVTNTGATGINNNTGPISLGARPATGTMALFYEGVEDEVRVYSGIMTEGWAITSYNSQHHATTAFYAVGDETEAAAGSESLSPSVSESASPSVSESLSPSVSESVSQSLSPSISISDSPSVSESASPSVSESLSPSVSESASPSVSESASPSVSESLSPSLSPSVSESLSLSLSPSVSESLSPSVSESVSESLSPSASEGISESLSSSLSPSLSVSPSLSPSVSESLSPSISESLSPSLSVSPSASPSSGYTGYTRGDYAALPGDDTDLEVNYDAQDVIDVATKDDIRVAQTATDEFAIHQYKNFVGANSACQLEWEGQVTLSPATSTVYLQIYNRDTTTWDTVDSDNSSSADTDFILTGEIADLTNYKDASNVISCRIYQEAI